MNRLVLVEIDCDWPVERLEEALLELPPAVQARAQRYLSAEARANLIVTQTCLRAALGRFGIEESELQVCPNGRPHLARSPLQFNLSHSGPRGVLALAYDRVLEAGLGVDIECLDRRVDRDALARRFFAPAESRYVQGSAARFFLVWTRKEAVLKSNGIGLRVPLDGFQVLSDEVAQEVSGRPLALGTSLRLANFTVSWAVAREWGDYGVHWVEAFAEGWLDRVAEGIGA